MDHSDNTISKKTVSRRDFTAMAALLGGVSIAAPASAQSLGSILGSAKKVIDAASYSDAEMKVFFDQMSEDMDEKNPLAPRSLIIAPQPSLRKQSTSTSTS